MFLIVSPPPPFPSPSLLFLRQDLTLEWLRTSYVDQANLKLVTLLLLPSWCWYSKIYYQSLTLPVTSASTFPREAKLGRVCGASCVVRSEEAGRGELN